MSLAQLADRSAVDIRVRERISRSGCYGVDHAIATVPRIGVTLNPDF
jgi:hypothetical protein